MNRSHPLRRPSTGSLSSLARSTDRNTSSPSGLDFLQPALSELNDEAATLASNISQLTGLHNALGTFNESFAGCLYALKMNAFCVEWSQVCVAGRKLALDQGERMKLISRDPTNIPSLDLKYWASLICRRFRDIADSIEKQLHDIQLATQLAEQQAHQSRSVDPAPSSPSHPSTVPGSGDMTYATAYSEDQPPPKKGPVKQAGTAGVKKAPSAAAKKQALSRKKQREVHYFMWTLSDDPC
jgi:DASH complex subunit DAM1